VRIRNSEVLLLWVNRLDRFDAQPFRSTTGTARRNGVSLVSVEESFDSRSRESRSFMTIMAGLAEFR
jgi:DNA invertase Pin-like site-specific DNA recombinase